MVLKKSQMELMGLAFIVVLIAIGLLFLIVLNLGKKEPAEKQIYQQVKIANSFILSFLKTSACNTSVEKLIYDCFTSKSITCSGVDSCSFLINISKIALERTFGVWGYNYNLSFTGNGYSFNVTKGFCLERESPGLQLIPLYPTPSNVIVQLYICKGSSNVNVTFGTGFYAPPSNTPGSEPSSGES